MHHNDTPKFIIVLYVLVMMFLGVIYFQGGILTEPDAITTLQSANAAAAGQFLANLKLESSSAFIAAVSITLLFGMMWFGTRSKQY